MISLSVTHRHRLCLNDNLHFLCLDAAFNAFYHCIVTLFQFRHTQGSDL